MRGVDLTGMTFAEVAAKHYRAAANIMWSASQAPEARIRPTVDPQSHVHGAYFVESDSTGGKPCSTT